MQYKKPQVWAHRGASGWDKQYAPENTLEAFQKAIEMGADGVETDVQLTRDGEIVICHDERIDRTSDGTGWIKDFTLKELRQYSFSKTHPEYGDVKLPTLAEFLELLRPTSLAVNIELKTGVIYYEGLEERTAAMVADMGMQEQVIYSSFNHYSLKKLKAAVPTAKIGLLMGADFVDVPGYTHQLAAEAVHPPFQFVDKDYIVKCHSNNVRVHTWTVDVKTEMKRLCEAGVDAIITNCPDIGLKIAAGDYSVIPVQPVSAPNSSLCIRIKNRFKREAINWLSR